MREIRRVLAVDMGDMMVRIRELELEIETLREDNAQKAEEIEQLGKHLATLKPEQPPETQS